MSAPLAHMFHVKVLLHVQCLNTFSYCAGMYGCGKAGCLPYYAVASWALRLFQIRTCS